MAMKSGAARCLEDELRKVSNLCHACHCLLGVIEVGSLQRCGLFPAPSSLRLPPCMGTQFEQLIRWQVVWTIWTLNAFT